jgi:hypothetical protein
MDDSERPAASPCFEQARDDVSKALGSRVGAPGLRELNALLVLLGAARARAAGAALHRGLLGHLRQLVLHAQELLRDVLDGVVRLHGVAQTEAALRSVQPAGEAYLGLCTRCEVEIYRGQ